ncbi:MAG: hypothetical protein C4542_07440 [Dehalococcoidia bacterium]|nr:MAG: hypothetical protein C4542_07440 [Dehalococcoidia bacterium]
MKFLEHRIHSFNRIRRPVTLPLNRPGIVLVEGVNLDTPGAADSNGAGKSLVIVETLLWALFGKMVRYGNRAVTDDAAHPLRGADVEELIQLDSGAVVRLRRARTAKGHPSLVISTLEEQGVPLSRDAAVRARDTEALFGLDYATLCAAVVLSGESTLAQAGFSGQMAVLEAVLKLGELNEAAALAAKHAASLEKERATAAAVVREREAVHVEAERFLAHVRAAATYDYEAALERLEERLRQAKHAQSLLTKSELSCRVRKAAYDKAQQEANTRLATVHRLDGEIRSLAAQDFSTACPTCKRPFDNVAELKKQRKASERRLAGLHADRAEAAEQAQHTTEQAAKLQAALQAAEQDYRRLETAAQGQDALEHQMREIHRQQEEQAAHRRLAAEQVERADAALREAKTELSLKTTLLERATFWVKEFGRDGLQAYLFAQALPVLNRTAAAVSRRLTGGTIHVEFNSLRTSRNEDLIRISGASAPTYEGLSRGEKERVNLIIAWALRALARWRMPEPVNLLVLDECLSGIDPTGMRAIIDMLHEEVHNGVTVFVITHNQDQKALFPGARVVRVTRSQGEAEVECL